MKEPKEVQMKKVYDELVHLTQSPLYAYRTEHTYIPVVGEGSLDATVMFVGEAPGKKEAETGRPFCGASGKLLDTMLESINLSRSDVYITSVVKDRPPENRDPTAQEIALYSPFLDRQLEIIQPRVIVMLGRYGMNYIFGKAGIKDQLEPINKMHGKVFEGNLSYGKVVLLPMYHPAYGLYNSSNRPGMLLDFAQLKKFL